MAIAMIAYKDTSFYVAYAPDSGVYSFGGCFEEAVNGLQDELMVLAGKKRLTGEGRKKDAQR